MSQLEIGQHVSMKGELGVIRFIGPTKFAAGEWIGIELDSGPGKNDGSLQDIRYFRCQKQGNYGVFVRPSVLGMNSPGGTVRPILEVQLIVEKLQQKLRAARAELDQNKKDLNETQAKLLQKSGQADDLETNLERVSVEAEFLKSQNITMSLELQQLQANYADLSAEYEILQEEMQLNRELEEEVRSQVHHDQTISPEDFLLLVQHNKRLELAMTSMKKLSSEKEAKFTEEINSLSREVSEFEGLKTTYESISEKLKQAETTITHLQEQLESANELDQIIEYLTRENESLALRNKDLSVTINELQEIHELDRTLEEDLQKVEQELNNQIDSLKIEISHEKDRVELLTSKHDLLRSEIKLLKAQPVMTGGNVKFEALDLELKTLKVQLKASKVKFNVSQSTLDYLESLNLKIVPQEYHEIISIFQSLGRAQSMVSEIQKILAGLDTSAMKIEVAITCDDLEHLLHAVLFQLEYEYDRPLESLGTQLQLLLSDMQVILEDLHFEDSTLVDTLSSHIGKLHSFCQLASLPRTISFYCLYTLLLGITNSNTICKEVLNLIPREHSSVQQLESLQVQTSLARHQADIVLQEFNSNKLVPVEKLQAIMLPQYSNVLLSVLKSFETSTSLDLENTLSISLFRTYLNGVSDFLELLKDDLEEAGNEPTLFQHLREWQDKIPNIEVKDLGPELIEKDKIINDLKLNLEVLDKNMGATIKGKSTKILELKEMLHQAKGEFRELEAKHKKLVAENKMLDDQVQSLFELNALKSHDQISAFEDLKSKKNYTTEMALAEEVSMLRNMVLASSQVRGKVDLSWLDESIYPQYKTIIHGELVAFETKARDSRAFASRILQKILSSKSTSIA